MKPVMKLVLTAAAVAAMVCLDRWFGCGQNGVDDGVRDVDGAVRVDDTPVEEEDESVAKRSIAADFEGSSTEGGSSNGKLDEGNRGEDVSMKVADKAKEAVGSRGVGLPATAAGDGWENESAGDQVEHQVENHSKRLEERLEERQVKDQANHHAENQAEGQEEHLVDGQVDSRSHTKADQQEDQQVMGKVVGKVVEKVVKKANGNLVQQVVEQVVVDLGEKVLEQVVEQIAEEVVKKVLKKVMNKVMERVVEQTGEKTKDQTIDEEDETEHEVTDDEVCEQVEHQDDQEKEEEGENENSGTVEGFDVNNDGGVLVEGIGPNTVLNQCTKPAPIQSVAAGSAVGEYSVIPETLAVGKHQSLLRQMFRLDEKWKLELPLNTYVTARCSQKGVRLGRVMGWWSFSQDFTSGLGLPLGQDRQPPLQ